MAIVSRVFKHTTDECENLDNTTAGLAKDIEDWITSQDATLGTSTNLQVTGWSVGVNVYTLVVMDND